MNRSIRCVSSAILVLLTTIQVLSAAQPSPSLRFEKEIEAYEAADRTNPPPEGAILFTGASGIRLWKTLAEDFPEHKLINRGFGGCHMADVVYFADRIVIPYKPKLIVVQAGGNDINAGKTPQQVLADFQALVERVRASLPETRIAYLSINPSPARWSQVEQQKTANRLVKDYVAKGQNLDYIELFDAFLGADGQPRGELYVADRLHHNAEGYKVRTQIVKPHLR
jgi:lysophospholipase L1-like esterase